jgi:myo-inositol-1(or 4)-monophosphatase
MPITARYMAAQHVARRAGQLAHNLFARRRTFAGGEHAPDDYAGHGSRAMSGLIVSKLAAAFPADTFVDEYHRRITDAMDRFWVIEAMGGKRNFMRDIPFYAVSIAYAEQGRCEAAIVYDPERDEMFHARRDQGAWCEHGGHESRLEVAPCAGLGQALIAVALDDQNPDPAALPERRELIDAGVAPRVLGAPALELAYVAAGRLDGFVGLSLDPPTLMGALLLVEEAGGHASHASAAGGIRNDLPIIGCTPNIAHPLHELTAAWSDEAAITLPDDPSTLARGRWRGLRSAVARARTHPVRES